MFDACRFPRGPPEVGTDIRWQMHLFWSQPHSPAVDHQQTLSGPLHSSCDRSLASTYCSFDATVDNVRCVAGPRLLWRHLRPCQHRSPFRNVWYVHLVVRMLNHNVRLKLTHSCVYLERTERDSTIPTPRDPCLRPTKSFRRLLYGSQ